MKIVVTGALGYLGAALIHQLPIKFPGARIILLDNLSTGQLHAMDSLPKTKRFSFIQADIRDFDLLSLRLGTKDSVIHLAGLSRPSDSYERPKEFKSVNTDGAINMAKACAKSSSTFFFPSTTSVYRQTGGKTILGCANHLHPQTPYAATKLKAEQALGKIKNLRYTVIRFGTIFGMSPAFSIQTAVNKFCWQAATRQPITVWETALKQIRPYLALDDATALIFFLIKKNHFERKTYHAGTCHSTVEEILSIIKHHCPSIQMSFQKANAMNALSYKVSSEEIQRLGFEFRGDLKKSVRRMLRLLSKLPKQRLGEA